jgi:hypothetical protein
MPTNFTSPTVPDTAFPIDPTLLVSGAQTQATIPGSDFSSPVIEDTPLSTPMIAQQVISQALDTQSRKIILPFQFAPMGAIQIGQVLISPAGIAAKNGSGVTTFAIDAATGNATFLGTVAAGSIVTGYIQVGGAASDVNGGSTTINGGQITTGSIYAAQIAANTITANKLSIASLDAITANLGSVKVGGSSNTNGLLNVYDSSGNNISTLNNSGIIVRNTRGLFWEEASAGNYQSIECNASSQFVIHLPSSNAFYIRSNDGSTNYFTVSSSGAYSQNPLLVNNTLEFGGSFGSTVQLFTSGGGNILNIQSNDNVNISAGGSGHNVKLAGSGSGYIDMQSDVGMNSHNINGAATVYCSALNAGAISGTSLSISGSKSAVIKTSEGWRKVYSAEAPEVWLFDFVTEKGKFDPLFAEMTVGKSYYMEAVDEDGNKVYQVWRHRRDHEYKRLELVPDSEFERATI